MTQLLSHRDVPSDFDGTAHRHNEATDSGDIRRAFILDFCRIICQPKGHGGLTVRVRLMELRPTNKVPVPFFQNRNSPFFPGTAPFSQFFVVKIQKSGMNLWQMALLLSKENRRT